MDKTEVEKWDFLEAVYQHGVNMETLSAALPTWTHSQMDLTIKRFRSRAKRKLEEEEEQVSKTASLNHWVRVVENLHQLQGSTNHPWWRKGRKKYNEEPKDHVPILSKTLMYAACFEDHYEDSAPDAPNYSEIYRYLSQLVEGSEPTHLSPGSAGKVLEMLNRIKKVVKDESVLDNLQHLQNLEVSYLPKTSVAATKKGKGKGVTKSQNENTRSEAVSPPTSCPLFEEEGEDMKEVHLEHGDPYYELKKEAFIQTIKKRQEQEASNIHLLPGLNPLEIPTKLLQKPAIAILEPQNL